MLWHYARLKERVLDVLANGTKFYLEGSEIEKTFFERYFCYYIKHLVDGENSDEKKYIDYIFCWFSIY